MQPISLLIADDHELLRKSFISLLERFDFIKVVGEAGDGRALLDLLKTTPVDLVILDLEMPVMNGYEALEIISKRFPEVKVIILSMHADPFLSHELMLKGARACVPKTCNVDTLIKTVRGVYETGYHFSKDVSKALLLGSMRQASINPLLHEQSLTQRELEVLRLLFTGLTNKEVASRLNITPRTVDFHRSNLYSKTNSSNITELVRFAISNGLVEIAMDKLVRK